MKNYLLTLLLVCLTSLAFAQGNEHTDKLKKQQKKCDEIMATFSGKPETLEALIKEGNIGLKMTKPSDHEFRFAFNMAIGTGYYYKQDFKNTQLHFEQAFDDAQDAKLLEKSLKPLGHLVVLYHYLGLQTKADAAAVKLKYFVESNDTLKTKSHIYYNLGIYNQQQKFYYSIALSNFLKAVELHKPIADTTKIVKQKLDYAVMLSVVAEVYIYMKQPKKAIEYLNEAKPYLGLSKIIDISAYGKFVRSYVQLNNRAEALKYYQLLHATAGEGQGNWSEMVSSSLEIAALEMKAGNFAQAKKYIDKADVQAKKDNKEILTSSVNATYGDYYKALKNYPSAIKYYKLAENGSRTYNKEQYVDLLKSLTAVEILSGNQQSAQTHFNQYVSLSDSLNQSKISLNLAEMEAKFQNQFKEQKIGALNKENDIKDLQLRQEKTTRALLIGGAVLLLLVLAAILYSYRTKQKANLLLAFKNAQLDALNEELSNANQTKTKLFSIISHDLRSPVSQLFTFLKLQQANPNAFSEENKQQHQQKLMQSSRQLLATMEDLLIWSKSQMEHFELMENQIDVEGLFSEAKLLMQNQADAKNLEINIANLGVQSLQSDENLLTIVLRNLIQNAINHAYESTAIDLSTGVNEKNQSFITVANKGDVISEEKINALMNETHVQSKSSGYGLVIVKELLQKIDASLQIVSDENSTKMTVFFAK
ncbi:MAG: ATP-binding protein [Pedobacter sp.]|uniref:tetratricopeptide repeat-containing sensor histidine kinase n=1 Tax=Pedobacter sp. TaxID=1411316 RepID=UPI00280773F3|nr:ATP-binding protein [Pedobacter sp.]MDQ8006260.1 ATP-binding protein [Pedobacter sp.]